MNVEIFTSLLSYIREFNERESFRCRLDIFHNYTMPETHEIKLTLSHKSYEEISNEIKKRASKAGLSDIIDNLNELEKDKNAFYFQLSVTMKSLVIFEKRRNMLRKDFYDRTLGSG